jgi:hypothetical protein
MKMESELAISKPETTEIAVAGNYDTLTALADKYAPRHTIGDRLKLNQQTGLYLAGFGQGRETIPVGTPIAVAPDLAMAGYVKWKDKVCTVRAIRGDSGLPPIERSDLDEKDKSLWPVGLSGEQEDPWRPTVFVPMMDGEGRLFTFEINSLSGLREIGQLLRRFKQHARRHPDVYPIVKLDVATFTPKDKKITIFKPSFAPAGYVARAKFHAALAEAGYVGELETAGQVVDEPVDEMNDEIPF